MTEGGAHLRSRCLGLLVCLSLALLSTVEACAATASVVDDGNNLRAWGGERYGSAPILAVLNQGDQVRVWEQKGKWTQVTTPEGLDGWVHSACLRKAPDQLAPLVLDPELRRSIDAFLGRLTRAAGSGRFSDLRPLLDPEGVIIQGRVFLDAAQEPSSQQRAVVFAWYASDVSLTYGSAWDLLMAGAHPGQMKMVLDKSTEMWRPAAPGEHGELEVQGQSEEPLLPTHRKSLSLTSAVRYVDGFPESLKGVPEPESFLEDPRSTPFGRVYRVGKAKYLLTPEKGFGLSLVLTQRPEGMVLKGVRTLSP